MENPPISKPITECIQVSGASLSHRPRGWLTFGLVAFPGGEDTTLRPEGANILDEMLFNSFNSWAVSTRAAHSP